MNIGTDDFTGNVLEIETVATPSRYTGQESRWSTTLEAATKERNLKKLRVVILVYLVLCASYSDSWNGTCVCWIYRR